MKGISTVIATILMLMITIALAGTAYLYISGSLTAQTQGIELADSFCTGTTSRILFRNIGTNSINFVNGDCNPAAASPATCGQIIVTFVSGGGARNIDGNAATVAPQGTGTITDNCAASTTCVYRVTPPGGRGFEARATCA